MPKNKTVPRQGGTWNNADIGVPAWRFVVNAKGRLGRRAHKIVDGKTVCGAVFKSVIKLTTVLPAECCWCENCKGKQDA